MYEGCLCMRVVCVLGLSVYEGCLCIRVVCVLQQSVSIYYVYSEDTAGGKLCYTDFDYLLVLLLLLIIII